jgi:hypothetical protein
MRTSFSRKRQHRQSVRQTLPQLPLVDSVERTLTPGDVSMMLNMLSSV